ncbi:MAG: hypothetical protein M3Y56_08110, partial [Armatimonadota bacterium]|nr:hypothetical protein [Armatimonadota bacterium]
LLDPYMQPRPSQLDFGAFRVSPADAAHDPLADLPPPSMMVSIGPVEEPMPLSDKLAEMKVELNDWVRFDGPGVYRVYAVSHRIQKVSPTAPAGFTPSFAAMPNAGVAVSNIIQLTILPQDDAWSHAQVEAALAALQPFNGHWMDPREVRPAHILRNLGTREAAQAMINRIATDEHPRSSPVESQEYYNGLVGFKDRHWLIDEMKRDLVSPHYTVTQPFLEDLKILLSLDQLPSTPTTIAEGAAALRAGKLGEREKNLSAAEAKFLLQDWRLVADTVNLKTGRAKAMSLHTLLELAWIDASLAGDAGVQRRVPGFTAQLIKEFDELPPAPQEYLLGYSWRRVRRPALLPALRRTWARVEPFTEAAPPETADIVLRRIYELSPAEGEKIILQQIASPHPKVSSAALQILPARTLPALDATLAAKLKDPLITDRDTMSSNELTTELIQRYASGSILPAVRAYYDKGGPFRNIVALLAYFLRVNPAYGKTVLQQELAQPGGGTYDFWTNLARRYYDPQLEKVAIRNLNDPDPEAVNSVARMLEEYGSPAGKGALLARLGRRTDTAASRERMEWVLVEALVKAQGWLVDSAQTRAIRALCTTHSGQTTADRYAGIGLPGKVRLEFHEGDQWYVAHYSGEGLRSMEAKIAEYRPGTLFQWQSTRFDPDEASLFKQVQAFVEAHGMKMERFKVSTG